MHEILFRGKRVDNGEWAESPYPYGTMSGGVVQHDFISQTLGQYTGLTDKNGVKIFEGDIVKSRSYGVFAVEWHNGQFTAESVDGWLFMFEVKSGEVIGNIYDDPELIKEYTD